MATAAKHQQHQQTTTTAGTSVVRRGSSTSPVSSTILTSPKIKSASSSSFASKTSPTGGVGINLVGGGIGGFSTSSSSSTTSSSISSKTVSSIVVRSQSPRRDSSGVHHYSHNQHIIDTDEDIATIAKQISDHAEAIYQTWKARGLAPTEILNCHTDSAAGDAFGKALTPPLRNSFTSDSSSVADFLSQHTPVVDMSNNNLEKLVSSFVSEDKARQQAARKMAGGTGNSNSPTSILTSGTIRDALKKFEGNSSPSGYVKPNFLIRNSSSKSPNSSFQKNASNGSNNQSSSMIITSNTTKMNSSNTSLSSSLITAASDTLSSSSSSKSSTHNLNQNVPDVLIDTINQTKQQQQNIPKTSQIISTPASATNTTSSVAAASPSSLVVNSSTTNNSSSGSSNSGSILSNSSTTVSISSNLKKPQTPAKPANLLNHTPSWPLKNRLNIGGGGGSSSAASGANTNSKSNKIATGGSGGGVGGTITNKNGIKDITDGSSQIKSVELVKKSADLLDEVSREEERLINALKKGIVLNNSDDNNRLPEVITSTLNDSNKSGHYSRTSSWIKKSNNVSSASSLQPQKTSAGAKVASTQLQSSSTTISTTPTSSILPSTTTSSQSLNTAPLSQQQLQQQQQTGSGSSTQWNDDPASKSAAQNSTVTASETIGSLSTTTTTTTAITTTATQKSTTDTMSPAPTPGLTKFKIRPKNDAAVPHPEAKQNSNNQNNHLNSRTNIINPVRPFLTRGSVAERVLMFEKCPDVKAPLRNINRTETTKPSKANVIKPVTKPTESPPPHTTLQRHIRSSSTKTIYIPKFHFPHGKPLPTITVETTLQRIKSAFDLFPNNQVSKEEFHHILKICGLPFYWRMPLIQCTQHSTSGLVDGYRFIEFWKGMSVYCHDQYSRFVYILSRGQRSRPYILHEDLASLVQDVVDTHPGLAFLKEAAEFHSRYVHTVIARIFYTVNRSWSGKITVPELRRSNLLQVIQLLEDEEDINQIMAFFSYEHFYVIYCKFWELDRDHDLFIDQEDLQRHNDHALSTRIIERIFSGCVTRGGKQRICGPNGPKMSYTDFVWFLLSEEDKTHSTAIEYWFRCMDLDGDGIISMYELEYFYEEQQQRMESIGIETLPFEDCLCQMLDMIKPQREGCITLSDLKRCRMTPIFFDTFFNLEKYLEHEQRDPFATQRDNEDGMTDWDRYAAQEYELLVAEEGGDTQGSYDEDDEYESNIDILESQLDDMSNIINEW